MFLNSLYVHILQSLYSGKGLLTDPCRPPEVVNKNDIPFRDTLHYYYTNMPYITVILTDGLGNRCFQIAALLGYAERHGHTPVLVKEHITTTTSHSNTDQIFALFPTIPIVSMDTSTWFIVTTKGEDALTYIELPYVADNILLTGYFQSERYFPRAGIYPTLPTIRSLPLDQSVFLHVRRGDYLSPYCRHHYVDLTDYWRRALDAFCADAFIIVASDDIEWCQQELPRLLGGRVLQHQWIFLQGVDAVETLAIMAGCRHGGICANSTFSWWGAYFNRSDVRQIVMPRPWGYPPMPPARDIYPEGALVLDATRGK